MRPISPAPTISTGNGICRKKIATNDDRRDHDHRPVLQDTRADPDAPPRPQSPAPPASARRTVPAQAAAYRYSTYTMLSARIDTNPGRMNNTAGHQPAPHAVHQPADVRRQLLGFGTGQQHAVVERMQKPLLGDPFFSSTRMRCITAICPAGPPKLSAATRPQVGVASASVTAAGVVEAGPS